MYIQFSLRSV